MSLRTKVCMDACTYRSRDAEAYAASAPVPEWQVSGAAAGGGGRAGTVGGKMGVGSVINLMIVASMVYRMGGSPWSLQTAFVNAKQNPVQVVMAAMMLSRLL